MVFGYILAVLCVFLLLKAVTRKAGLTKADRVLRKCHIGLGIGMLVVIIIHFLVTLDVWDTRQIQVIISGILLSIMVAIMAVTYLFRKKLSKRFMFVHRIGAVCIILLLGWHVASYFVDYTDYQDKIASVQIYGMDASNVKDGIYQGHCDVGYINATVKVTVKDQRIIDIKIIEHNNERGKPAEAILDDIVEKQSTSVDAVSGATNSSKVLKKAVEDALSKGIIE